MTATVEIVVEGRGGDVVLAPLPITDTIDIGFVEASSPINLTIEGGAPGPPGPKGDQGPMGSNAGSGTGTLIFPFLTALSTWLCPHNLHRFPTVTVVDGEGKTVLSDIRYDSIDMVRIEFGSPTVGRVFLI